MEEAVQEIMTLYKEKTINSQGILQDFYRLIGENNVEGAIDLMQNHDKAVDRAIKEYNAKTHDIMRRGNKTRKNQDPYITEKLPRSRQRYINEVELFFLLGNDPKWSKEDGDDAAYELFSNFLKDYRIEAKNRQMKRLAGAETEAALVFHLYKDAERGHALDVFVAARSTGYKLRPLFDQYGALKAFAYGYRTKGADGVSDHWDIQTADFYINCEKRRDGWEVSTYRNDAGKILAIYASQPKAWDGVESRIKREEWLDSKTADTNNYFADPVAMASADVVKLMSANNKERIGTLIQATGPDSIFKYVDPPQNSESRAAEKQDLKDSILFDTFTPDMSFENLKGFGSISGVAIKNAMSLGYIKRANRMEIYGELFDREISVIKATLKEMNVGMASAIDNLDIKFEFTEPFASDSFQERNSIASLYQSGLVSLEEAVSLLALTKTPEAEIDKLKEAKAEENEQGNNVPRGGMGSITRERAE